jgi:CheY-like chemotaxis protein
MTHKRILCLLVEDFEDSRFMMRRLLEYSGYRVVEATDGEEAVKMAVQERPQIILMDLSLPKLDGLEATRRIRETSATTPIIAVSAHDSPQTREGALAAGCDEYVTKPVDLDHLTSVLEQLLTRRASPVPD